MGPQYTISATGEVTVGKKRNLQLLPAASDEATRQDRNYAHDGIFLLDDAHREGTWEFIWFEDGRLMLHHFTDYDSRISPLGSPHFWGAGEGSNSSSPVKTTAKPAPRPPSPPFKREPSPEVEVSPPSVQHTTKNSYKRLRMGEGRTGAAARRPGGFAPDEREQADEDHGAINPVFFRLVPPEGTFHISYWSGGGEMTYHFEDGHARVSKKRWVQLIEAGSPEDPIQDRNYIGTFLLNSVHREGTWEYVWLEYGKLVVHHFTENDTGISPLGSPNFYGVASGVRR